MGMTLFNSGEGSSDRVGMRACGMKILVFGYV